MKVRVYVRVLQRGSKVWGQRLPQARDGDHRDS
jgi:hypothetical protein